LSNPLTVIEQMTYLLFIKRLDELQQQKENKANLLKRPIEQPLYHPDEYELRWSRFKDRDPEAMFQLFTQPDGVFDFMRNVGVRNATFSKYMKGATFMIPTPRLLAMVVDMLSKVEMNDRDTNGDLYEYLLSKIASAGKNGQFRTPRHIIRMMVELVQPQINDIISDTSAGTCGFLNVASEYVRERYEEAVYDNADRQHFNERMFMGMEFDPAMIRIGAMNMILHGIENPNLRDVDS